MMTVTRKPNSRKHVPLKQRTHSIYHLQFGLKSYAISKSKSTQRRFDLKSQVLFQTKISGHVHFPHCYIHFEIAKFSRSNAGFFSMYKYFIDPILSWFVTRCSICLSFSWNLIAYSKQANLIGCWSLVVN